jgi:hypothetical protein
MYISKLVLQWIVISVGDSVAQILYAGYLLVYLYVWLIIDGMFIVWALQENFLGILSHQTYI